MNVCNTILLLHCGNDWNNRIRRARGCREYVLCDYAITDRTPLRRASSECWRARRHSPSSTMASLLTPTTILGTSSLLGAVNKTYQSIVGGGRRDKKKIPFTKIHHSTYLTDPVALQMFGQCVTMAPQTGVVHQNGVLDTVLPKAIIPHFTKATPQPTKFTNLTVVHRTTILR